ncbi:hypothetical protein M440DRAFT_1391172 [Trichoderma longibrachiatum ATCC 18648]|uniref:Uncharacterized protein n=1 Tax=Trichoderma longibrachiatum ATCC 18648 TaxID=983965 RepID=A0A2T4C8V9_TRILO|nr:hypothetical protein M440DRAFT_1391172 [Trichoderma longibrachiatum ATCC 18648]
MSLFLPLWAFLFLVWVLTKLAIALWPTVFAYLSLVAAFAPDKDLAVAVVSWLSLLRYWKPWASATADLRREVDLAIDYTFLAWFLMGSPFVVLTIWAGLKEVLRLVANAIVRRIHVAMEFEFDLTDYVVKCYSPMDPGSMGDRVYRRLFPDFDYYRDEYLKYHPRESQITWPTRPVPRSTVPRVMTPRTPAVESVTDNRRTREWARQKLADIRAGKTAAAQPNDQNTTPFDTEPVPQSREAAAPAVQSSAWPTAPESDPVADVATTASISTETEEPADLKESKGEGQIGAGPKAPEPEASLEVEGNGLLEGAEDSKAQEPETSHGEDGESLAEEPKSSAEEAGEGPLCMDSLEAQEPDFDIKKEGDGFVAEELETSKEEEGEGPAEEPETSSEEEGEGPAQEPKTSPEEEGESSLSVHDPANDPEASLEVEGEAMSSAKVPQAAQEPEASSGVEGDGMLMVIDSAQTEEPEVSSEAEGEGSTKNEASPEVEFDVEMADVDTVVPRPVSPAGNSSSLVHILPLEVVAPWSPAGQAPGFHDETRGYADMLPYLESEYASMDPALLDREIDNILADTDEMEPSFVNDDDFEAYASFLSSVPDDVVVSFPGADAYDDDEVMEDAAFARPSPLDLSDDGSVTSQESPISDFFGLGILRDSGLDEEMASLDLNGAAADPEVEFLTAALARLTLTSHVGDDITMEQQLPQNDPLRTLAGAGAGADGGADADDETPASVTIASPAVMKAIRDSEARRGVQRLGNADER